ncbi:NAD(P)H-dependent oxidoreductase [Flavobacterium johnsoniae]|jgi:nitroreductase|uniref:Nitroreductase n=2 Tax=Flavobacterium johnsoniae TaxID=986 RepID=A0A1M5JBM0_FLAJO|nr:NAD(P)H-dependent oxidoreductase [Flavobacterium johnsoniae]ABQ07886.1 nitroreductase [Flavobacterium johnsoniae UW101]OXG01968.1 NAD(P)H-dependent oxidoreductase [Flavobacterium johnsoniae UW101]WQG80270.1 NAD(P)H-dependent oxidoreductase [Flavobacterium johnsoniae UW101]SHG37972.1 Nitroreductase [Flavobacterium johnsoniae]SHK98835.1 Nitroreductase [Flavobacterium johnsoniae]
MSTLLDNLKWRYATKKFDATKKISAADLNTLKEAVRLAASSYGLQPYKVIIVENPEIREKLKAAAYGQTQITDASQLFIFANDLNAGPESVAAYIKNISETRGVPAEALGGFADMMNGVISNLSQEAKNIWTAKQTYIALGTLLAAAAELKIDATPMEGFNPAAFNEILGFDKLGLNASVIATVGYRHDEDDTQHYKKVRKSHEELFITI